MTPRQQRHVLRTAAALFLPLAVAATLLSGLVAVVAQQALRTGADSPQLGLAEDAARALDAGSMPAAVTGPVSVDIGRSLVPFLAVFDDGGHTLSTSGRLDGADPAPPIGVLEHAAAGAPNRVTWQPRDGLRLATVTVRWSGGTVMAGRSLREVERRVDASQQLVALGWAATLIAIAIACVVAVRLLPRPAAHA
jgi:hypothetical protein